MAKVLAKDFVAKAKSAVGSPYWYACSGQAATADLLNRKIEQYSGKWSQERIAKAKMQIGAAHVFDCIGLVRWCSGMDKNAAALNTNADTAQRISVTYPISTIATAPPGVCVFMKRHIGIYIGGGRVVEAWGFRQVDDHPVSFQKWEKWGYISWVDYGDKPQTAAPQKPPAQPLPFKVGDKVCVKPTTTTYYPGSTAIPAWLRAKTITVEQVTYKGQPLKKGGAVCVLLGDGICTWCAVENLVKVEG